MIDASGGVTCTPKPYQFPETTAQSSTGPRQLRAFRFMASSPLCFFLPPVTLGVYDNPTSGPQLPLAPVQALVGFLLA
jgi:hypothetical protein